MFQPQANTAPLELTARLWYTPAATGGAFTLSDVSRFEPAKPAPDAGANARPSNSRTVTSTHARKLTVAPDP